MSVLGVRLKDPNDVLPLSVNWTDIVLAGETLSSTAWAVEDAPAADPSPLATSGAESTTANVSTQKFVNGSKGYIYNARARGTFASGLVLDRSISVRGGSR